MSLVCNLKTPYTGFYGNRSKVEIDYMALYVPVKTTIQQQSTVSLSLQVQLNMINLPSTYVPFDIVPPKNLSEQIKFIVNPIHVDIKDGFYKVVIELQNLSSSQIVLLPGSAIAQINMDQPFKVIVSSIKNE